MDREVAKMLAHADQTRSNLRAVLLATPPENVTAFIRICAAAKFEKMDEKEQQLAGLLAVTAIFDLLQMRPGET